MKRIRPWLWVPVEIAHHLAPKAIDIVSIHRKQKTLQWSPLLWKGIEFPNRLGIAGGVDKNAINYKSWSTWGPGFIEIGTVTPLAQKANPGPIVMRDTLNSNLWNKLGFPNDGGKKILSRVEKLTKPRTPPLFINIGKNRNTPNEKAAEDYVQLIETFGSHADAFVVNISSPNTSGLRELLQPQNLNNFLNPIIQSLKSQPDSPPLLLKMSPDIEDSDLKMGLDISGAAGIDGWILNNTTLSRPEGSSFPSEGGLSGKSLSEPSKRTLQTALHHLGSSREGKLVVSVGGVLSPSDVFERLEMGADLVQVYTALIFEGPWFFEDVAAQAQLR